MVKTERSVVGRHVFRVLRVSIVLSFIHYLPTQQRHTLLDDDCLSTLPDNMYCISNRVATGMEATCFFICGVGNVCLKWNK